MDNSPKEASEIYATLVGRVDDALVKRLFEQVSSAVTNGVQRLHLMVQSSGGIIGDGIAIHNYLKNIPMEIITYNAGMVQSIAVPVFLSGKYRRASKTATFMIHKATFSGSMPATAVDLNSTTQSLVIDDARIEGILKQYLHMPEEKWNVHRYSDLFITADEALQFGMIDEIADFKPPSGAMLLNI